SLGVEDGGGERHGSPLLLRIGIVFLDALGELRRKVLVRNPVEFAFAAPVRALGALNVLDELLRVREEDGIGGGGAIRAAQGRLGAGCGVIGRRICGGRTTDGGGDGESNDSGEKRGDVHEVLVG